MKFIIKKAKNGQFYYELIARNGKIMFVSETMKREGSCKKAIASVQKGIAKAKVIPFSIKG